MCLTIIIIQEGNCFFFIEFSNFDMEKLWSRITSIYQSERIMCVYLYIYILSIVLGAPCGAIICCGVVLQRWRFHCSVVTSTHTHKFDSHWKQIVNLSSNGIFTWDHIDQPMHGFEIVCDFILTAWLQTTVTDFPYDISITLSAKLLLMRYLSIFFGCNWFGAPIMRLRNV